MSKIIEFKCELCRGTHFDKAPIVGVYWVGPDLVSKRPIDVDNHLCLTCINAIKNMEIADELRL